MSTEYVQSLEIDIDYCANTYGSSPCTAALGASNHKCFNTFKTCQDTANFIKEVKVVTFSNNTKIPIASSTINFPLLKSITSRSTAVNITGANERMKGLGVRASITAFLEDAPYNDSFFDKYNSERISGAAQTDEGPYDPFARGTVFAKLKSRWPFYAGRPMRVVDGVIVDGVYSITSTRHYIITDFEGPDQSGKFVIKGKDILDLADDKRVVAPKFSEGVLLNDISDTDTTATLTPLGVGSTYSSSGWVSIGSELIAFTRVGDVLTLVSRGSRETDPETHEALDTIQETFSVRGDRVDVVVKRLLVEEAGIDASFIPDAKWTAECDKWASTLFLNTDIMKPTGVNSLIGEVALLGVSIWWDDKLQEVGLKVNRPPVGDAVHNINDSDNLFSFSQKDKDEDRLSQVAFYHVQSNPSLSIDNPEDFKRQRRNIDVDAESANEYDDTRLRRIFSRWLNDGNDSLVSILNARLLNRFREGPAEYVLEVPRKTQIGLTDVLEVTTRAIQDDTGKPLLKKMQVFEISEGRNIDTQLVYAQAYQFDKRYGGIAENTRGVYSVASDTEKDNGTYFSDETTGLMGNGDKPYAFI